MGTGSSSGLVPACQKILKKNNLKLSDFDFMAVNHGPGAFTSLRVIVVTVNSINFASGLPILPVCGLDALFTQTKQISNLKQFDAVACLLNAYSGQTFVKVFDSEGKFIQGFDSSCLSGKALLEKFETKLANKKVLAVGNGCKAFSKLEIPENFVINPELELLEPDVRAISELALKRFMDGQDPISKVIPNYLKAGFV